MSAIRSLAQIPASIKYLEAVVGSSGFDSDVLAEYPAFRLLNDANISDLGAEGSIVLGSTADANLSNVESVTIGDENTYAVGTLFKDLGRQLLIKGASDNHVALFRQVQLVNGADTEGVSGVSPSWNCLFVKVWAADGTNVCVARTGPGA
jgi:hypothetical protein